MKGKFFSFLFNNFSESGLFKGLRAKNKKILTPRRLRPWVVNPPSQTAPRLRHPRLAHAKGGLDSASADEGNLAFWFMQHKLRLSL
jgi:hypothetical protein